MILAFDQVVVQSGDGSERRMSAGQFLELPLYERIELIVGGHLRFLRDEQPVEQNEALKSLRS